MSFQQQAYIVNFFLMLLDALSILFAGIGAYYFRFSMAGKSPGEDQLHVIFFSISLLMILNNYTMGRLRLYNDKKPSSVFYTLHTISKAIFIDFAVLALVLFWVKYQQYSRLFLLLFALLSFFLILIGRIIAIWCITSSYRKGYHLRQILVIGDTEKGELISDALESQLSWGHKVIGRLTICGEKDKKWADKTTLGTIEELPDILRRYPIDEVIFAVPETQTFDLSFYLEMCEYMGVPVKILPCMGTLGGRKFGLEKCQNLPFLVLQNSRFNATGLLYKRVLDLVGGLVGTVVLLLFYPLVAAAIKLTSPGPVIFKQKRVGKSGRIFTIYKFRTMYSDAEQRKQELLVKNEMHGAMFKVRNDPRITPVGSWLRKSSIDELPQFLNVLKGEMSLVGTRPPTIDEVSQYQLHHLKRISVKPGLTGLWQVSGRNTLTDFDKVVELDCYYLDNWRFVDDLRILIKTVGVVALRTGAL